MNTNILSVRFFVKKYKAKNNRAPIYVRITLAGKSVDASLKHEIGLESWSVEKGHAKGTRSEIKALNSHLDQARTEIANAYNELKFQDRPLSAETVKNQFCGIVPEEHTLISLIEYHNSHLKNFLEWGTMKNYMTTQKYIQKFLKEIRKASDIPLSQLSYSFLVDFEIFLKNLKPEDHHKPCGHNTVLKHVERLRKMINLAIKNEWIDHDPFAKFQARFIRNNHEFLTLEELSVIEAKETKILRLQWAKDLFVFSCYTGLAYCDVMELTPSNISIGIDGDYWVMTSRKKTNQPVRVPLLPRQKSMPEPFEALPGSGYFHPEKGRWLGCKTP